MADRMQAALLVVAGLLVFLIRQPVGFAAALRLSLPDSDDAMRLVSLRDFLGGENWFDMTVQRYLPPAGVTMHWSRIPELPLYAGIRLLTPWLGPQMAERLTVATWPLILFAVLCGVVYWGGSRLFSRRAGGLGVLIAAQMVVFGDLFAPGRIDHHNLQIILVTLLVICFGLARESPRAAIGGGLAAALSLAIGLETLPFVAVVGFAYAAAWIAEGEAARPAFLRFSLALATGATLLFAAETAPARWLVPACDALSPPWLLLAVGAATGTAILAAATRRLANWRMRAAAAAAASLLPLGVFAAAFPACLAGPYEVVPEPYRTLWLGNIPEAFSFARLLSMNPNLALQAVAPMAVAALAMSVAAWRTPEREAGRDRAMLILLAAFLWLGVGLAQMQIRTVYISAAALPLAGGFLLDRLIAGRWLGVGRSARALSVAAGLFVFGVSWGGLALIAAPASDSGVTPVGHSAQGDAEPGGAPAHAACDDPDTLAALDALPPGLVLAPAAMGPYLLLHTHHAIGAAGDHRGAAGIVAALKAFSGPEAAMRAEADRFRADYLVICPALIRGAASGSFAQALSRGASVSWLTPLKLDAGPLAIWRIDRP